MKEGIKVEFVAGKWGELEFALDKKTGVTIRDYRHNFYLSFYSNGELITVGRLEPKTKVIGSCKNINVVKRLLKKTGVVK